MLNTNQLKIGTVGYWLSNTFSYDASAWSTAGGGNISVQWPTIFDVTKIADDTYRINYHVFMNSVTGSSTSSFYDYGMHLPNIINAAMGTTYTTNNTFTLVQPGSWDGIIGGSNASYGEGATYMLGIGPLHYCSAHRVYWGRVYSTDGSKGGWPFSKWSAGDSISGWFTVKVS